MPALAFCYTLPNESAVPGGVKIIRLDIHGNTMPYVDVDGHRALVVQDDGAWIAIVGIPLSTPLGTHQVIVRGNDARREIDFTVGDKRYASQSLKVAPRAGKFVAPPISSASIVKKPSSNAR